MNERTRRALPWAIAGVALVLLAGYGIYNYNTKRVNLAKYQNVPQNQTPNQNQNPPPVIVNQEQKQINQKQNKNQNQNENVSLVDPIDQFRIRITKKPFGIYVTPQNSPVSPEKFTGYHTGTDVEYGDITSDVPVFAINDGDIVRSGTASGYGGYLVLKTTILNNMTANVLYGHLRPSSLATGHVKKGQQIAVLGTAYSAETDGERRHLHISIPKNGRLDIKGYVQNKSELANWYDPAEILP